MARGRQASRRDVHCNARVVLDWTGLDSGSTQGGGKGKGGAGRPATGHLDAGCALRPRNPPCMYILYSTVQSTDLYSAHTHFRHRPTPLFLVITARTIFHSMLHGVRWAWREWPASVPSPGAAPCRMQRAGAGEKEREDAAAAACAVLNTPSSCKEQAESPPGGSQPSDLAGRQAVRRLVPDLSVCLGVSEGSLLLLLLLLHTQPAPRASQRALPRGQHMSPGSGDCMHAMHWPWQPARTARTARRALQHYPRAERADAGED